MQPVPQHTQEGKEQRKEGIRQETIMPHQDGSPPGAGGPHTHPPLAQGNPPTSEKNTHKGYGSSPLQGPQVPHLQTCPPNTRHHHPTGYHPVPTDLAYMQNNRHYIPDHLHPMSGPVHQGDRPLSGTQDVGTPPQYHGQQWQRPGRSLQLEGSPGHLRPPGLPCHVSPLIPPRQTEEYTTQMSPRSLLHEIVPHPASGWTQQEGGSRTEVPPSGHTLRQDTVRMDTYGMLPLD